MPALPPGGSFGKSRGDPDPGSPHDPPAAPLGDPDGDPDGDSPPALVSLHDVTPENFPRVREVLGELRDVGVPPCTLLVVPGKRWEKEELDELHRLARGGYRLAGHGWLHQAPRKTTLYHRLHGLAVSRDQAEHLSRSRRELRELVQRSFGWFDRVGLPPPELYVPPAWALGRLTPADLGRLPFRWYEVLGGIVHGRTGRTRRLPLVGFEADTRLRQVALRAFNPLNVAVARRRKVPLRISVHPHDLELLLAEDLRRLLRRPWRWVEERDVMG